MVKEFGITKIAEIEKWYKTPLGLELLKSEQKALDNVLPKLFGYYIAQIGGPSLVNKKDIFSETSIHNHIVVNPSDSSFGNSIPVKCDLKALPFLSESIDVVVLFHVLEFIKDPETLLQEISRSLVNGGTLIVLGFNPYSLWGIKKFFQKKKDIWDGNWISPGKMHALLVKVGFYTGDYQSFYFRPPSANEKMMFLEGLGQIFWSYCGASYMYVAKKTSEAITPIVSFPEVEKSGIVADSIPKPTSRITDEF